MFPTLVNGTLSHGEDSVRGDSVETVLRHSTIKNVHYVGEDIFDDIVRPSSSFQIILTEIFVYNQRVSGRGAKDERIVGDEKQLYTPLVTSQSSLKLRRLKLEM